MGTRVWFQIPMNGLHRFLGMQMQEILELALGRTYDFGRRHSIATMRAYDYNTEGRLNRRSYSAQHIPEVLK